MGNVWVELKDKNNLYRNLILLKSYFLSNGYINDYQETDSKRIEKSIKELLGDDFDVIYFRKNVEFLLSEGIFSSYNYLGLTTSGISYVEKLINELGKLSEEEKEIIKKSNTDKLIKFLGISSKFASTVNPIISILNLIK
ncbi:putative glutamine amidotransferase [Chryseobacterium sp. SORGH_AS 447]|uniref:hypothetical protein n=1 Tax=Chryseobacterium sp. SORGH_AS_0447 TaxID=3041769 RepID=UPI0027824A9A|nr:hypothetical protein [Chryseobacterium sp. SORGH_AS_0447]MDQ1162253.1 putative glutamine amidotransferase [Chryseobacterium sp. SORGH_AS_0447]